MDPALHKERNCIICKANLRNKRIDAKYCNNCLREVRKNASKIIKEETKEKKIIKKLNEKETLIDEITERLAERIERGPFTLGGDPENDIFHGPNSLFNRKRKSII